MLRAQAWWSLYKVLKSYGFKGRFRVSLPLFNLKHVYS